MTVQYVYGQEKMQKPSCSSKDIDVCNRDPAISNNTIIGSIILAWVLTIDYDENVIASGGGDCAIKVYSFDSSFSLLICVLDLGF